MLVRRFLTTLPLEMTSPLWSPSSAAESVLHEVLDRELRRSTGPTGSEDPLVEDLRQAVACGGKRLRPTFAYWGYVGATGEPPAAAGAELGAALELLHTFALVHDDVMDGSEQRRGEPSVHARHVAEHTAAGLAGDARRFGDGMAILIGDLAFALANRLISGLGPQVCAIWHDMCTELVRGQYLDVTGTAARVRDVTYASHVAALKSGRYTVTRPLQLGAATSGASTDALDRVYESYGEPLGQAFQLRDDLMGAFGDPAKTGKPVGADLRDGKPTVLLALLVERAPQTAQGLLDRIGEPDFDDDDVAEVVDLAVRTGARYEVTRRIAAAVADARSALDDPALNEAARPALLALTERAAWRET